MHSRTMVAMAVLALPLALGAVAAPAQAHGQVYRCDGRQATIVGTQGWDNIHGTSGPDVIVGLGGRDFIDGGPGEDTADGHDGTDTCASVEHHRNCEVINP